MPKEFLKELYDIVLEITDRGEVINSFYSNVIKYLYCKYNDVSEFVYSIEVDNIKNNDTYGLYNPGNKSLKIDSEKINKNVYSDDLLEYNLNIVISLLHELEHANQHKIIKNNDYENYLANVDDFMNYVLFVTRTLRSFPLVVSEGKHNDDSMIKDFMDYYNIDKLNVLAAEEFVNVLYEKLYDYDPNERTAEIKAYMAVIDMLPETNNLYDKFYTRYLGELIRGYVKKDDTYYSPLSMYFREYGLQDSYIYIKEKFKELNNDNEFNSLLMGFPIKKSRLKEIISLYELRDELENADKLYYILEKKKKK